MRGINDSIGRREWWEGVITVCDQRMYDLAAAEAAEDGAMNERTGQRSAPSGHQDPTPSADA